jgi:hypothetical protein
MKAKNLSPQAPRNTIFSGDRSHEVAALQLVTRDFFRSSYLDGFQVNKRNCRGRLSSEKHFSLSERQKHFFRHPAPGHIADISSLAAWPFWPVAERPCKLRSDEASMLLPPCGFMFAVMTAPFGSLKLTS